MCYLHMSAPIREGFDDLISHDPVFRARGFTLDSFDLPVLTPDFAGLCRIVLTQQISMRVAEVLFARLEQLVVPLGPLAFLATDPQALRGIGLSAAKVAALAGLAEAIVSGRFDPAALSGFDDADVHGRITALKGFGSWSAHMVLMLCLCRPDIWPVADLGLRTGLQRYYSLDHRPDPHEAEELGVPFRLRRTAASLLLWKL